MLLDWFTYFLDHCIMDRPRVQTERFEREHEKKGRKEGKGFDGRTKQRLLLHKSRSRRKQENKREKRNRDHIILWAYHHDQIQTGEYPPMSFIRST
jgi:hypothetical protein